MEETGDERKSKRQCREKSYKSKAFEKFKQLKSGARSKYEVEEIENVYETVDEKEYVKRALDQQDDEWIVDDDGSGYVEDGRDIFDDDLDEESIRKAKQEGNKGKKKKKALSSQTNKGNLKYMFSNISGKKKEETQLQDEDNMLSEILEEIDDGPSTSKPTKTERKPFVPRKVIAQNYFKKFENKSPVVKKTSINLGEEDTSDVEPDNTKTHLVKVEVHPQPLSEDDFSGKLEDINKFAPAIEQMEEETTQQMKKMKIELDDFDDDFDESAMLKIDDSQLFDVSVPNCDSQIMQVDAPFETVEEENSQETFRFFWWDAFEDPVKQPGIIFLFGKTYCKETKSYVSCCVAVKNITRQVFVLPRPFMLDDTGNVTENLVTFKDLYLEFATLVAEPMRLKTYKAKLVNKKYAFDPTVPKESDYLEVRYPATDPRLDVDVIRRTPKTFSKIFGINTSSLERFLIDAKLKGPCWLEVKSPEFNKNPLSWCKYEVNCLSVANLTKVETDIPPPPLVIATVNFRFHINAQTNQNEILMASCVAQSYYNVNKLPPTQNQHFCVIAAPATQNLPPNLHNSLQSYKFTRVQKMDSEKALINYFITQFSKIDPDVVVGHNLRGLQIVVLANRLTSLNISTFSKLSKLNRSQKKNLANCLFTGRLVVDLKISAKELIKSRSYDLPTLCQQVLKIPEKDIMDLEPDEVPKMYETAQDLLRLVSYTMQDTSYMLNILYELNVIPLALEITRIAGNVMSRTLLGGRSERNEYLLLHAFSEKNYIVPDKQWYKKDEEDGAKGGSRKKPTYSGGMVLDPKVGFYDKLILVMDFNSLYPSIIQEFNICFTTTLSGKSAETLASLTEPPGILPTEIRKLVESRRQVKALMEAPDLSPDLKKRYHIRQMALKLTANSMYGCLGFSNSRFYAKNLAALVTEKGRDILMKTKYLVEHLGLEVLYGDTDSIMINTGLMDHQEALNLGRKVKHEVNKTYKTVELDIDGIFKYLLLLKKKKYAAVTIAKTKTGELKTEVEYKGLDIVRRDWSKLACEAGKLIIDQIFSDQSKDEDRFDNITKYLGKLRDDLKENKVPVPLLVVTKQLTRDPHTYSQKDNQAHVLVALRYNKEHGGNLRAGDTVPYVICDDGTTKSATQRAYHPEELKSNKNLKIDHHYYLAQQIHPVVTRICEPIDGLDAYLIAEYLGLDGSSYKRPAKAQSEDNTNANVSDPAVKYRDAENFSFICLGCKRTNLVTGSLNSCISALTRCANVECDSKPVDYLFYVENQLTIKINEFISKYYKCKLICEDPACTCETYRMPLSFSGKLPICPECRKACLFKEYSDRALYYQLEYFSFIFTCQNAEKVLTDNRIIEGCNQLRANVRRYIDHSAYGIVDFTKLAKLFTTKHESLLKSNTENEISPPDYEFDFSDEEFLG